LYPRVLKESEPEKNVEYTTTKIEGRAKRKLREQSVQERVVAIIPGVSWSSVCLSTPTREMTDRVPLPVHYPSVPSLLLGLPYTLAQGRWVHVPICQSRTSVHMVCTYPLLAAPALIGLPMTILLSGIPAYEFISKTEVDGQLDPELKTKDWMSA